MNRESRREATPQTSSGRINSASLEWKERNFGWKGSEPQVCIHPFDYKFHELILGSGPFERYNIARNHLRFYNNVGMTASYEIDTRILCKHGLDALTFAALRRMIDHHPAMSVSIEDEDSTNPSWVRLPVIDLKRVVRIHTIREGDADTSFRDIIEAAHRVPFEELGDLPLWFVVLIQHPTTSSGGQITSETQTIDVGFFWHHGFGDGVSGVAFHLDFLDALNDLGKTEVPLPVETLVIPPKLDLLPSLEEAHALPLSIFFLIKQAFKMILPRASDKLLWTGNPLCSENNITNLRTLFLPADSLMSLLSLCQENKVTFTSLLIVVIARVLATVYPSFGRFRGKTAISFRRFTGTDNRAMVNYTSSINHIFSSHPKMGSIHCGGDFSWDAVRACCKEIKAATASPKNHGIALLKYLNDYSSFLRSQIGTKRIDSFEVSNIGVVDGGFDDERNMARVKRVLFSQSSNVMAPAYVFSVATAKGGDLGIALTWQQGIVDTESVDRVLVALSEELRSIIP